jgi:hypothetical protein
MTTADQEDALLLDLDLLDGTLVESDPSRIGAAVDLASRGVLTLEMSTLGGRVWARIRRANGVRIEDRA